MFWGVWEYSGPRWSKHHRSILKRFVLMAVDGLTGAGGYPAGFLSSALASYYPCKRGLFITALDHKKKNKKKHPPPPPPHKRILTAAWFWIRSIYRKLFISYVFLSPLIYTVLSLCHFIFFFISLCPFLSLPVSLWVNSHPRGNGRMD